MWSRKSDPFRTRKHNTQRLMDVAMIHPRVRNTKCRPVCTQWPRGTGKEAGVIDKKYSASTKSSDKFIVFLRVMVQVKTWGVSEGVFTVIKSTYSPKIKLPIQVKSKVNDIGLQLTV